MAKGSKKYELNKEDLSKLGKGAGIACASALVVYVADVLPMIDFGQYTAVAVAVGGILINLARKWIADNKK